MTDITHFTAQLAAAAKAQETLPSFPEGLTLEEAYGVQAQLAHQLSPNNFAGLKAGLTNSPSQKHFGVEHPLLGYLYEGGEQSSGAKLAHKAKLAIECEIGIVVDGEGKPKSLGPAIEIVYLDFAQPTDMTGVSLAASNLGAYQFIKGPQQAWRDDCADMTVTLTRDREQIVQAPLTEALGGPVKALDWMFAEANRRGVPLHNGMFFMTGSCGGIIPSKPGHYRADYGVLGSIEFEVVASN